MGEEEGWGRRVRWGVLHKGLAGMAKANAEPHLFLFLPNALGVLLLLGAATTLIDYGIGLPQQKRGPHSIIRARDGGGC